MTIAFYTSLILLAIFTTIWARWAFFQPLDEALAERIIRHRNWFPTRRVDAAGDFLVGLVDRRLTWLDEQALLEPITPSVEYMKIDCWTGQTIKLLFQQAHLFPWPGRYELTQARREAVVARHYLLAGDWQQTADCFNRALRLLRNVSPKLDQYQSVNRELAMVFWPSVWHFCLDEKGAFTTPWPLSLVVSSPDWCRMFDLLAKLQGPAGVRYQRSRLPAPYQGYADIWLGTR
ncbi:TPA: hypothetical protein DEP96_02130 [Candidatus Uhrbacteria bacterium]|nr:hypothetical protein [Candidatus Uhrbacteria bacterium]